MYVQAGFSPMEALQAATRNPAIFLDELSSQGTVEIGKIANLVSLDASPLDNISDIKRIDAVILNGKFFPKTALQLMLANVEKAANARMN